MKLYLWYLLSIIQRSSLVSTNFRRLLLSLLGCEIHPSAKVADGVFIGSSQLAMGSESFVNIFCFLDGMAKITLGECVRLGPYVKILTGTHTYTDTVIRRGPGSKAINLPVTVERGCWVGMGAIILPGVIVREGCIIAAGAVVVKSTEPNGLYGGNPAKRIKDLPVEEIINK